MRPAKKVKKVENSFVAMRNDSSDVCSQKVQIISLQCWNRVQESVGTPPTEEEVMIPVEGENGIGDGAEPLDEVLENAENPTETPTE